MFRGVAQLVARTAGGREVAGSSPVTPTILALTKLGICAIILRMAEISRQAGRLIALSLIAASGVTGYAIRGSGGHDTSKPKATTVAKATPKNKNTTTNPAETTTSTSKPKPATKTSTSAFVMKKANMQLPLTPTGGDYNTAASAAFAVDNDRDVPKAEGLLGKITNPQIKAQGEHAVQIAMGANAAFDVSDSYDVLSAEALLGKITLPGVKTRAQEVVSYAIAANAAFDATQGDITTAKSLEAQVTDPKLVAQVNKTISQERSGNTDGATTTWVGLNDAATSQWVALNDQATSEWNALYLHTDDYLQQYNQAE